MKSAENENCRDNEHHLYANVRLCERMCRRSFSQHSSLERTFFNIQDVRTMKRRDGRTINLPRRFRWQDDVGGNADDDVGDLW